MRLLKSIFFFILRLGVALVFIWAGVSKLGDPAQFLSQIRAFDILPYPIAYGAALCLPWLELLCGLGLLTLRYAAAAALILSLVTIGFINFISTALERDLNLDCGCFGQWNFVGSNTNHILLNAVLLLVLIVTFWRSARLQRVLGASH